MLIRVKTSRQFEGKEQAVRRRGTGSSKARNRQFVPLEDVASKNQAFLLAMSREKCNFAPILETHNSEQIKMFETITLSVLSWMFAATGTAQTAGEPCTFNENTRYSELVINSRINDFKANTKDAGFGKYDTQGKVLEKPQTNSGTLDYVPGLVAKAILEAADYYKDSKDVDVMPWYYAIKRYGNSCDITQNGKQGKSFDDLNGVKLYFKLQELAADTRFADNTTLATAKQRFADARTGFANANENYVIKESTLAGAAGGWWHKSSYTDQMWCDGLYMGAALMAQMINEDADYTKLTTNDWNLITKQFTISWNYLWDEDAQLLYHAFTADPAGEAASKWAGISAEKGKEIYHSAEFWGRAEAWYFMALVDVLEQMQKAKLTSSANYKTLKGYLTKLAAGIAAKQDAKSGCWYQLINHDGSFSASNYDSSYRYTSGPVNNYLESSCTAIFTAAYLKGVRLGLLNKFYRAIAKKAYKGFIEQFMVADGKGGVHLIRCCKSAGLGGGSYRDGSAAYYLMGKDTEPTSTNGDDFYTEGKVLGGFIMAATEYERMMDEPVKEGPTMGWSSWNTFALNISESIIKNQAAAMVSKGLAAAGYDHINIDDGYFGGRDEATGQLKIHPTRFPNGLKPVVEYIHQKGLKAGIYSDGGHNTCGSYHGGDKTGVGVGLYEHDQQDCDLFFKDLDFDFIKVDFCGGDPIHNNENLDLDEKTRYTAIAKAIKNTGRTDVRMNICRWAYPGTWADNAGFSWRTTGDIYDGWNSVKGILAENLYMSAYCSKGHYNDMDMLEVGRSMTTEEDKTHFGMWCIMNSPLLIGCNMQDIKTTALNLLKNEDLIALNQDTLYQQAYLAAKVDDCYIMVKDIEKANGLKRAFAIYNPNDAAKTVTLDFKDIDLADSVKLHDCFTKKDVGTFFETYQVSVPKHGTKIYVAEADTRLERTRYEAETGYSKAYSEIEWNVCQYSEADYCSGGYKAGYIGGSNSSNYLEWHNVYSKNGGDYQLTIGYICGENRTMTVYVNGKKVKVLSGCNSGDWKKVGKKTLDITLEPGVNTIRLVNTSSWMPDIDYIDVISKDILNNIHTPKAIQQKDATYNLMGQTLNPANATGIVIEGGKKIFKK